MPASILSGEFLLHIPCWLQFYLRSFSYTSRAGFNFIWGVSFTHPELTLYAGVFSYTSRASFLFFIFFNLGSFSYTSHACLLLLWGVSLTLPVLASFLFFFLSGEFVLHILLDFFFFFFSLTHPMLASIFSG